ncbi:hypothetical protein [Paraurantiacibacter namhicola]|uniref:Uncharacterized protein n=1 Tax=Paraurantiacibacter namhicola TaxID=645517 RepID=A0A1C7D8M3_9SPHN|nr:hypothetical protein [Paraurantiacibacter namhicola]ANU07829.1 hypothetical protein A6F65_01526 [Paraurantiacibacter namhicola]
MLGHILIMSAALFSDAGDPIPPQDGDIMVPPAAREFLVACIQSGGQAHIVRTAGTQQFLSFDVDVVFSVNVWDSFNTDKASVSYRRKSGTFGNAVITRGGSFTTSAYTASLNPYSDQFPLFACVRVSP